MASPSEVLGAHQKFDGKMSLKLYHNVQKGAI